uniref:Uncharacterized protein n=1 Tax=Rhizophora mucronata TaxID=61149 RepID=A0A2P2QXY3_RHIMU
MAVSNELELLGQRVLT